MLEKIKFGFKEFAFTLVLWLWMMVDDEVTQHFWSYFTKPTIFSATITTTVCEEE
jgi:hypothetical protein